MDEWIQKMDTEDEWIHTHTMEYSAIITTIINFFTRVRYTCKFVKTHQSVPLRFVQLTHCNYTLIFF